MRKKSLFIIASISLFVSGCATYTTKELFQIGEMHQFFQNYKKAIPYYKEGLKRNPEKNKDVALTRIGFCYAALGKYQIAEKYYRESLEVNPDANYN